jgi:hypothetical protein
MSKRFFKTGNVPDGDQVVCIVAVVSPGEEGWGEADPQRLAEQQIRPFAPNVDVEEINEPDARALIAQGTKAKDGSALVPPLVTIYKVPSE